MARRRSAPAALAQAATAAKKGIHSSGPPPVSKATDLTLPTAKERARSYLSQLQRGGKLRAVVQAPRARAHTRSPARALTRPLPAAQYVVNGARFKLLVPKENCVIIFCLAGIRCPQTSRNGSAASARSTATV